MRVAGATGERESLVNGVYEASGRVHNGHSVLHKAGSAEWCLYHCSSGRWMAGLVSCMNQNLGVLQCTEQGLAAPHLALQWRVVDRYGKWHEQGVTVTLASNQVRITACGGACREPAPPRCSVSSALDNSIMYGIAPTTAAPLARALFSVWVICSCHI